MTPNEQTDPSPGENAPWNPNYKEESDVGTPNERQLKPRRVVLSVLVYADSAEQAEREALKALVGEIAGWEKNAIKIKVESVDPVSA